MKRGFSLVGLLAMIVVAALMVIPVLPVSADQYERVVFASGKSGTYTNSAVFFNAKVLTVRARSDVSSDITNTVAVTLITTEGLTNAIASMSITTTGASQVDSNNWVVLRNDKLTYTATTNATVEVLLDNRSR